MVPHSSGEDELLFWATWGQPNRAIPCSVEPQAGWLGRSYTLLAMVCGAPLVLGFPFQQTPSSCLPQTSSECPNGLRQSTNTQLLKFFDQLLRSSVTQVKSAHASIFHLRNICCVLVTYLKSWLMSVLILQSHWGTVEENSARGYKVSDTCPTTRNPCSARLGRQGEDFRERALSVCFVPQHALLEPGKLLR